MLLRFADSGRLASFAVVVVLVVMCAAGAAFGQILSSEDASPGFTKVEKQFSFIDLAGRPWVGEGRNVRVRIDQDLARDLEMYLPDPLYASENRRYPLDDAGWSNRFTTEYTHGQAVAKLVLAGPGPNDPMLSVPYELTFFYDDQRHGNDLRKFTVSVNGIEGLPKNPAVIRVQDWVRPTQNQWLLMLGAFVIFMLAVTFGVYRPLYKWRLSKGGDVESARDMAVFVWWLFALLGYAAMLYWRVPWSLPYMVPILVLIVVVIFRLVALFRRKPARGL